MNLRLSAFIACFSAGLVASCTPYNENQGKKPTQKPAEKTVTSPEQQKIQQQRDAMKEKKQAAKTEDEIKPTTTESRRRHDSSDEPHHDSSGRRKAPGIQIRQQGPRQGRLRLQPL